MVKGTPQTHSPNYMHLSFRSKMKRFPIICNYFFFIFHIFHNVKSVLKRVEVSVLQEVLFDCHMEQKEIDN